MSKKFCDLPKRSSTNTRASSRWNGRQIRNAIQIASSLAQFDARKDNIQPRLTVEHFKMIHLVTEDFDQFMQETVGKTDGEMAFERGDRADHWSPDLLRPGEVQSYDSGVSLSPGGGRYSGGLSLGSLSLGQQHSPNTARGLSNPFDRGQAESSLGLRRPSPNSAMHRPSWGQSPPISFDSGPDLDFRHREPSPGREYTHEHRSSEGYDAIRLGH